jgi:hypothetical protein
MIVSACLRLLTELLPPLLPSLLCPQDAGLKVKEYELIRKNFSDAGNFGECMPSHAAAVPALRQRCC